MGESGGEDEYGDFGGLSAHYSSGRKGFPAAAIAHVLAGVPPKDGQVLDIGCGTGIATRLLAETGRVVVGTDRDERMLDQARRDSPSRIPYLVAPAESQPFPDNTFDLVTAFSAFHWFCTCETLDEIRRVLKPGSRFCAINKDEYGGFKKGCQFIMKRYTHEVWENVKYEYDPVQILAKYKFKTIDTQQWRALERLNRNEAIEYAQSISIWNMVSNEMKATALEDIAGYVDQQCSAQGEIFRKIVVTVVSGHV